MAGYVLNTNEGGNHPFHINEPDVSKKIRDISRDSRVVGFSLDGDELDAALWGLEHYRTNEVASTEDEKPVPVRTLVTFTKGNASIIHTCMFEDTIPNIVVEQLFLYEHVDMKESFAGKVTNIQHHAFPDGSHLTYIDVAVD